MNEKIDRLSIYSSMLAAIAISVADIPASAQSVRFEEDALCRGYYDRPWERYEAEPGMCDTNGTFLLPDARYSQEALQSEASGQTALTLSRAGEYVSWRVDSPGRGVTLRFSVPDSSDGKGLKSRLKLSVSDGRVPLEIELDSFWAWQYTVIAHSDQKYPDNTPSDDKFARMRFDEVSVLLDKDIPSGAILTLTYTDGTLPPCTIDFVELEPVAPALTADDIASPDKVVYDGGGLASFVSAHGGKTIFIPAGLYAESRPVNITVPGTRIIGAGMWYTTVNFTAPSDDRSRYSARGFHCSQSNVELSGMSIMTVNNCRYFNNNPSFQVGKGLNGSWGENSRVSDLRIEHFECGAWISGGKKLTVERCRMRNNYADGINLANNSTECIVSHCSFRNNGDDDMASWSTGDYASDNEFCYNTAENNWRASSLGIFGGRRHRAHHIAVYDAMEAGVRVTCDFPGPGFSDEGEISLSDITIRRCGAMRGTPGVQGGFWGAAAGALELRAGYAYNLKNVSVKKFDILDSRDNAISLEAQSGKRILNLRLFDINVRNVGNYAYAVNIASSVKGSGTFGNIKAEGVQEPVMAPVPAGFDFREMASGISAICDGETHEGDPVVYDLQGRRVSNVTANPGIYLVRRRDGVFDRIMVR